MHPYLKRSWDKWERNTVTELMGRRRTTISVLRQLKRNTQLIKRNTHRRAVKTGQETIFKTKGAKFDLCPFLP
jgi:hypothetical protein